ncbi:hypothetical protein FOZ61_000505 [Perkinsus olseni]|uniref:Uncharacterized protein n=1 Tax=Perkinsus olseni TaxID=32597 RepID=A0A7J6KVA7_PEROL|nr:hypothetical protein FOZ61_000505 [Perkinsus olseni]KAF4651243.1 hypothetical protein FOL46_000417 [Perkinsus olseni]
MKREHVDEFECGQLFLAGTNEDFEGHLLFKTKTDYSFAGHITRAFSESPVRIEVDLNRSSYIRVVANTKLYKGDLIWVCRTLRPSCGKDASDSDTSAVSTPAYPTRRKNSVKRKISDRSAGTSRSSDRKRQTVEGRDEKSSMVKKKANRKLNLSNVEVKAARRSAGEGNRIKVTPVKASLDVTKMGPVVDMNLSAKKRARESSKKAVDHPPAAAKRETKVGDGIPKKGKKINPVGHHATSKEGEVIGRGELTVDDGAASTSIPSRKQKRPKSAEDDHIPPELEGFMVADDEVEEVDLDEDESDGDYSTSESDD